LAGPGRLLQMERDQLGKTRSAGYSVFVKMSPLS